MNQNENFSQYDKPFNLKIDKRPCEVGKINLEMKKLLSLIVGALAISFLSCEAPVESNSNGPISYKKYAAKSGFVGGTYPRCSIKINYRNYLPPKVYQTYKRKYSIRYCELSPNKKVHAIVFSMINDKIERRGWFLVRLVDNKPVTHFLSTSGVVWSPDGEWVHFSRNCMMNAKNGEVVLEDKSKDPCLLFTSQ